MDSTSFDSPDSMRGLRIPITDRVRRVVMVIDLVESVRLMHRNESDVIERWRAFVRAVQTELLSGPGDRLVKSLGDGLMLEFVSVQRAVRVAAELHVRIAATGAGRGQSEAMWLRIGVHVAPVVIDGLDIYGSGVNLVARVAASAAPGETIVTQDVRDELVPGLDADVEDIGERYFKHVDNAVRCFRVGPPGKVMSTVEPVSAEVPAIAVVPFWARPGAQTDAVWGDLAADEIICGLSRTTLLRVISRQSTAPLRDRQLGLAETAGLLGVRYVLSGSFMLDRRFITLMVELSETRTQSILLSERFRVGRQSLVAGEPGALHELLVAVAQAIVMREVQRLDTQSLPSLDAYSLLLSAVNLMHSVSSVARFQIAYDALTHLAERYPRHGAAQAWIAKWHVMRVVQGWSPDPARDAQMALQHVRDALRRDPCNALALTIDGQIQGYLFKDLAAAEKRHIEALDANPNEALAWIYRANVHAWQGRGEAAEQAARHALGLSPLDPLKYYYESLAASAVLVAGRYEQAVEIAQRSLRVNRTHISTYRCLTIAQMLAGQGDAARASARELLRLEPGLTVSGFLARYPGGDLPHGQIYGKALLEAGVPTG